MCSERKEGSERIEECPENISSRSERDVLENIKVKVRQKEDLTDLISSVMHGPRSSEVD